MGRPELGTKATCDVCNERFYDLNRSPAICPKCGAEQRPVAPRVVRSARPVMEAKRFSRKPEPVEAELEPAVETETEEETVEIEEDEEGVDLEVDPDHDAAAA
jgi:uncharacterized protein (TIGR02300 family)